MLGSAFGVLLLFASAHSGARLELQVSPDCKAAAADFRARVTAALVGVAADDRVAHVVVERRSARVSIQAEDAQLGTTRVATASCEEAVAAAVAVLALSLSAPAEPPVAPTVGVENAAASDTPASAAAETREAPAPEREPAASSSPSPAFADPPPEAPRLRFALRAGVDAGTLPVPTGYVGTAVTLLAGPIEWRAVLGFGLPSVEERIDPGIDERQRHAFALLDLGGCYRWGRHWQLAACGAGELGVVYAAGVSNGVAHEHAAARFSGVLGAQLAYRGGVIQPELELAGVGTALGADARGPFAVRASLGFGLQF